MSPTIPESIPRKLARLLAGQCRYSLCAKPLADGSCYCEEHDAQERARKAVAAQKRRTRLGREGQCLGQCGKRVPKSERGRFCPTCWKAERQRVRAWKERSAKRKNVAPVPDEPRTKLETHLDGYTRVRTTGRGVRGQKSRAELDDDLRDDLREAIHQTQAVSDSGIAMLRTASVTDMGRIQRREAHAIVADRLLQAARTLVSVAEALCPGREREVADVRREARDD
jgi:hypothetical protein